MLQPRIPSRLGRIVANSTQICSHCSSSALYRPQTILTRHFTSAPILRKPQTTPQPPTPAKDEETFVPKPLGRPIGFSAPPQPGENSGYAKPKKDYSGMTLKERNLAKRADLVEKWGTNYFRDFKNIRKYREGKTFVANPRIFKKEVAMYFPNLRGDTLEGPGKDTTDVLKGRVSVVNLYSSAWGEAQVKTFTGRAENPELHEILKENDSVAQQVDVNIEENTLKAWIVQMFAWRLRLTRKKEDWGRYFVVRRGVSQMVRESVGALNGRVGYVYLVDADCKIRWAGSANAEGTEKDDLVRGLRRCVEEAKNPQVLARPRAQLRNAGGEKIAAAA
ncbi:Mitochondrial ATPase complex subunit atp10 [Didymosphaeria variabile]|uniref:Mitochondrial ATPase complex subunit atp10 n=1 Tax=Didymosphaeria variabile TaxID=1932322 RepID=A0A9W9CCB7_9PLEO|nr:Mitochondrial ATPase complex subunit atp10 [Didymosphaeria variabile]KAJ4354609.1 Mitochondrial ATPase complex subunit atp10 [Didymosphaeria variabile]